jgi:hypothetical protein
LEESTRKIFGMSFKEYFDKIMEFCPLDKEGERGTNGRERESHLGL